MPLANPNANCFTSGFGFIAILNTGSGKLLISIYSLKEAEVSELFMNTLSSYFPAPPEMIKLPSFVNLVDRQYPESESRIC